MKKWTQKELITEGYKIENAKISRVDLSMADHGCLTLALTLEGSAWGCNFGGYCLGHGYLGADDEYFDGSRKGIEYIMRIMDTTGCERFNDMKGKYVRVATKGWGGTINIIGNVINDKWFDQKDFFKECKAESKGKESK